MKSRVLYIVLILFLLPTMGFSQKWKLSREELMYGIGFTNYFGDIGGSDNPDASSLSDFDVAYTRPGLSIAYRYRFLERFAAKGSLSYLNFHSSDVGSVNEGRNYSFSTNMFELYGHVEYHITPEKQVVQYSKMALRGGLERLNAAINVYAFAGLSVAYFKPKALDDFDGSERFVGNKNLGLTFPLGIGLKYPIGPTTFVGLEISGRFTTTDYIDGFKPEASKSNDLYYSTVIYVSHKIKRKPKNLRKYRF